MLWLSIVAFMLKLASILQQLVDLGPVGNIGHLNHSSCLVYHYLGESAGKS